MAFGDFQVLTSWALPRERFAEAASTTRLTDSTVANEKLLEAMHVLLLPSLEDVERTMGPWHPTLRGWGLG